MDAQKIKKLQAFLAILPDKIARQLAVAIEYDRLDGGVLPHDAILEGLRPALQRTGLKRQGVATAQRAFFEPFEDLFTADGGGDKRLGCIARRSLTPIWHWLERDLIPAALAEGSRTYSEAVHRADDKAVAAALGLLWSEAHGALHRVLTPVRAGMPDYDKFVKRLGNAHALEDAREIGLLAGAASAFRVLQNGVPRGLKRLAPAEIEVTRLVYDTLMDDRPDQAAFVPVIILRRLSKPANVMEVLKILGQTDSDAKVAETTLGLAGDLLLSDFEDRANFVINARLGEANAHEALAALEQFADMSAGLTQSLDIRREGRWGKRLVTARSKLAEAMERRIEKLPDEIIAAFPVTQAGGYAARGGVRPNIGRWPEDAKIERAANLALFLGGARWLAGKALFGVSHKAAVERVAKFLTGYGEDLVAEIKAGDPDAQGRCQAHLQALLRITALVMSEKEADLLRRRAAIAGGQAQPPHVQPPGGGTAAA